MATPQWARLEDDIDLPLRRGAWYPVTRLSATEVVVDVNRRPTAVPRRHLQLHAAPPTSWTVVPRPRDAVRMPSSWGDTYAVCPNCRERSPLNNHPSNLRCHRCNGLFPIAWDERYLARRA
jgi:hypothetical protein